MSRRSSPLICFLSPYLPSETAAQAGQRIAFSHLAALARRFQVALFTCGRPSELQTTNGHLHEMCSEVHVYRVSNWTRLRGLVAHPALPLLVASRAAIPISSSLATLRRSGERLLFWVEWLQMAYHIPHIRPALERSVVVCHDIPTQLFRRRAAQSRGAMRFAWRMESRRVHRWQAAVLQRIDTVVVLNEKDAALVRPFRAMDARVLYPEATLTPAASARTGLSTRPTMVFLGAMDRRENEGAVLWFSREIFPIIRRAVPSARFIVVGAHPSRSVRALQARGSGIEVTGYCADPHVHFARAWCMVAPLTEGAGITVKVVEGLANGLPVVATPVAAEGIPAGSEEGLIIRSGDEQFARACVSLLQNPDACMALSSASRTWYQVRYAPLTASDSVLEALVRETW